MKIKINKKKLALNLGLILTLGGVYEYIYNKLHTNTPDDVNDHTGKYVLNPDYYKFNTEKWVDLKSVYPTKLAYDPKWFILPPDKYITKEQPVPKNIKNISDPMIRRQAYFNFLCQSESLVYITDDIKNNDHSTSNIKSLETEGLLDLTMYRFMPKTTDTNLEEMASYPTWSNPFILLPYNTDYIPPNETHTYNLYYSLMEKNEIEHKKDNNENLKFKNTMKFKGEDLHRYKEVMSYNGDIYKIEYDPANKKMLPLQKEKTFTSRYYQLSRYIEREEMKNLGIAGYEEILYDMKEKKLVSYEKNFIIGAMLPWYRPGALSDFSWAKAGGCQGKPQFIDKF